MYYGPKIMTIKEFFAHDFCKFIERPYYQRPYEWGKEQVTMLLDDLRDFKNNKWCECYQLGCVVLFKKSESEFQIIDGQQRLITLWMLMNKFSIILDGVKTIADFEFAEYESKKAIKNAWLSIEDWFHRHGGVECLKNMFDEGIDGEDIKEIKIAVIVMDGKIEEAFQLFNSQNSRGKPLDVNNLLKAYHLHHIFNGNCVVDCDSLLKLLKGWKTRNDAREIEKLLTDKLFKIEEWEYRRGNTVLTKGNMSRFYGVSNINYEYRKGCRGKEDGYFEIGRPFRAGEEFFLMVDYFRSLQKEIELEFFPGDEEDIGEKQYNKIISVWRCVEGCWPDARQLSYVKELFLSALLLYCNRFGIEFLDVNAAENILVWAFSLRFAFDRLERKTVDNFAIGESDKNRVVPFPFYEYLSRSLDSKYFVNYMREVTSITMIKIKEKHGSQKAETTKMQEKIKKSLCIIDKLLFEVAEND